MASELFFGGGCVDPAGCAFVLCTEQPAEMRWLTCMCVGLKYLPSSSATPSWISLWHAITRPPLLQSRVWHMEKSALHPSQNLGRSGSYRQYFMKRASLHSWAPSSVPLTIDGCTVSHAPVFVAHSKWCANWTGSSARVSTSASYDRIVFLFLTSHLPSRV